MVTVQLAENHHYPEIVHLLQQEEPYFTLSIFEKKYLSSDKNLKIIALNHQKIIGFIGGLAHTLPNNDILYWAVDAIVDKQHRKQGIATLLLKTLIHYGQHVIGIGVRNKHILQAEINAGFKVSRHLRTFTAYPLLFSNADFQKIHSTAYFETLLDTSTQTTITIKKEKNLVRVMNCTPEEHYLSLIQKLATWYRKKVRFLVNTRHHTLLQTSLKTFSIPAKSPEILIYTHEYMRDLSIYFGHSDWFMEYE